MKGKAAEAVLIKIDKAFGFRQGDFDRTGHPIITHWINGDMFDLNVADLGEYSLKIGKNLGDVYFEKIKTDKWVIVGKGTTLHCDDITVGEELIENFEGYLM